MSTQYMKKDNKIKKRLGDTCVGDVVCDHHNTLAIIISVSTKGVYYQIVCNDSQESMCHTRDFERMRLLVEVITTKNTPVK